MCYPPTINVFNKNILKDIKTIRIKFLICISDENFCIFDGHVFIMKTKKVPLSCGLDFFIALKGN